MKKLVSLALLVLILITTFISPSKAYTTEVTTLRDELNCKKTTDLMLRNRELWTDHVLWTRNYIISNISNLEDKNTVLERLLKNQDDIGNALEPYYGKENAKKLSGLLREHISLAGQVLEAAKSGNKEDLNKYNTQWYKNADDIATFLSSLNPKLSKDNIKEMLNVHLQLVTDQVVANLNKKYDEDIIAYDKGQAHMTHFADIISESIIKQFPEKFK